MVATRIQLLAITMLAAAGSAAGCVADTGDAAGQLELGTGSWRFEPLEDGQEVALVRGAQGGWHVWVSLRVQGMTTERPTMTLEIQPADESQPPQRVEVPAQLDPPDDEGRRAFIGWPAILGDPSCQVGEMLRLEAHLADDTGKQLTAQRYITPTPGPYPPPPCE